MTWARRKDLSQKPIEDTLRERGIVVFDISRLGDSYPDLLCYDPLSTLWLPIECKSDRSISHHRKADNQLSESQLVIHATAPIPVVETPDEALALFGWRQ